MTEKSQEERDRLERISRRMGPPAPSRGPRIAVGILIGVLPGLGPAATIALLLPTAHRV